ncbi:MAG TPA: DUF5677 domain-containing protein [Thermoanaerobaculia bacterium]|nr:DUF5677 domain-containing protein [Thermoanaerobaculia bacterium]
MDHDDFLPDPPVFEPELLRKCKADRFTMPLVFEWHKYVAIIAMYVASLLPDAPGARDVARRTYVVLTGLLMRCGRIMRAILELAKQHRFGETVPILTRTVCESALKLLWLADGAEERIDAFVADGLAAELELKKIIERNADRRGFMQVIEQRMLASIDQALDASGIPQADIKRIAKLFPNVRELYAAVAPDHGDDLYVLVQKIGSHATHGTWLDLVFHYTEGPESPSSLNYDHMPPDEDGLRMSALLVLDAIEKFLARVSPPNEIFEYVTPKVAAARDGLMATHRIAYAGDFERAE